MAFDLDNEELKATRKLHNQDDGLYEETSDKNVANIERLNNFANMTFLYGNRVNLNVSSLKGLQEDTKHLLAEREQDKKKIQELEADLYSANCTISDYVDSIPKQKVKDKIEEYDKKMTEDAGNSLWVVTDRIVMNVLNELLEDK